jgi:hypothetical protein
VLWLVPHVVRRVDERLAVDRGKQLGRGRAALVDGRVLLADLRKRKRPDNDGEKDIDDDADVGVPLGDENPA